MNVCGKSCGKLKNFNRKIQIKSSSRRYATFPELPPCDFVPQKYQVNFKINFKQIGVILFRFLQGISYERMKNLRKNHLNPALSTYYSKPIALHQGYKEWLFDVNGKRYLDMYGGICTVSVGHSHP